MEKYMPSAWVRLGTIITGEVTDRFWHAGLSSDSSKCFVAATENEAYFVWDIASQQVIWVEDGSTNETEHPDLDEWLDDGFITIDSGKAQGRYRIFGLRHNNALELHPTLDLRAEVDKVSCEVVLKSESGHTEQTRLRYESGLGGWAFASFSDDGDLLAVLEPYYVTLYRFNKATS